jgi:hypothetical protein
MDGKWDEVGGRYRRMELTSNHEGAVLPKQMGVQILAKSYFYCVQQDE